jgi:hypothetical protein
LRRSRSVGCSTWLTTTKDTVAEILEEVEETDFYTDDLRVETDKAWDVIHRCLSDGTREPGGGEYPLSHAILGGRHMHDDYYVCYVTTAEVQDVAVASRGIDEATLYRRYDQINDDYQQSGDEEDFRCAWENFADLRDFYNRAAAAARSVFFTAT